jgi:hypothetical protein
MGVDASHRVRQRINDWVKREGRGSKKRLADAVASRYGNSKRQGWVTGVLNGPEKDGQDVRLADLDDVAKCLGMPPGDLVRQHDRNYLELTMAETRLIQHCRTLPDTIRNGWIAWLDYMFRFQHEALKKHRQEREQRTARARRHESERARSTNETAADKQRATS